MATISQDSAAHLSSATLKARPIKLSGANVWKVFGRGAKAFLDANPNPDPAQLHEAGLIGVIDNLTAEDGGTFIRYNGEVLNY